jgi:RNA polymerase sigma factor (TIGR02999 family)
VAASGDRQAFNDLVPLVYEQLRAMATGRLAAETTGHTLTPTALVHEAYLRLAAHDRVEWHSRSHFFAVAALAMRRILSNHARDRTRAKRGAGAVRLDLDDAERLGATAIDPGNEQAEELVALDDALERLRAFNPEGAEVVTYRFFGGLQFREMSEVIGVSEATVRRRWTAARAWLRKEVRG